MVRYDPLAHDLRISFDIITKVGLTFVIARPDFFVVGSKSLEEFIPFGLTIFVVAAVMQSLVPEKVLGSKKALTSVPDIHPRLAILIEMVERRVGTVEDPLQRRLTRKTRLIMQLNKKQQSNNSILTSRTRLFEMDFFLPPITTWAETH
jgi:hypothetical protein